MRRSLLAVSTALSTLAAAAQAQVPTSAPAGPTAASSDRVSASSSVAEVVVTAQKREQHLQDVPIVVTVVGAQLLADTGVRDIKDLTILTPGLNVTSTSNETATTARIRGIGTVGENPGLESSVGIVVDGVYRPRNGVGFGDIGELSRVEVLKGPQGTVFGKNTSAGVINILTAQPSFKAGANAEFTVGNYGEIGGSAAVTGPLVADQLAGSLFFAQRARDGFYDVVTGKGPRTQTDDQDRNFYTMRGQLLYAPSSDLSARLILDYTRRSENCCAAVQSTDGPTAPLVQAFAGTAGGGGLLNPADPYRRLAFSNRSTTQSVRDGGASLEINYAAPALNGAKVTSITAYRDWIYRNGQDSDFTALDLFYRPPNGDSGTQFKQFSQELRLGGTIGRLDYTVGGFYSHEKLNSRLTLIFGRDFLPYASTLLSSLTKGAISAAQFAVIGAGDAPGLGQRDVFNQDDESYAFFFNNTYHVTDRFELTGGFRYTSDDKTLVSTFSNTDGARACAASVAARLPASLLGVLCLPSFDVGYDGVQTQNEHAEEAYTGTAKASYRLSPELLGYASYSRGYKSGGFNLDRITFPGTITPKFDTSFPGEFNDSYELGLKSTLFERRLYLNATLFHQDFSSLQLNTFNGLSFIVASIPSVTSTGLDTDFLWRPMTGLTAQGGVTYANTRFASSDRAVLGAASLLPGARLPLSPLFSVSGSLTYERPLVADLVGRANINVKFDSDYNTGSDLNPLKNQDAFSRVGARVGVGPQDRRWSVELWVENLFDTHYAQVIIDAPFQAGSEVAYLGAPRTFGITLRGRY